MPRSSVNTLRRGTGIPVFFSGALLLQGGWEHTILRKLVVIREVSMTQNVLVHITLMALGVVVLLAAGFIGARDRGGKKLNTHKALAGIGVLLVLAGVVGLVVTRAFIPTLPHFFIAVVAIVFMLMVPISGLLFVKAVPVKKAALRKSHRMDAMIFYGLAGLAVIFGILSLHLIRR
jgi:hypothetical protein